MARKKNKGTDLSVFKGREAKLNRAILQVLTRMSPRTIYEVHKQVIKIRGLENARYSNVNTRLRALEKQGYIRKMGVRVIKVGFKAALYEATARAYFALLISSLNFDALIHELNEIAMLTIISEIMVRNL